MAVDTLLLKELMAAKKAPRDFAAVPGKKETALVLSKRPIPGSRVKAMREEVDGTKVFRGRCFTESATTILELTDNPPAKAQSNVSAALEIVQTAIRAKSKTDDDKTLVAKAEERISALSKIVAADELEDARILAMNCSIMPERSRAADKAAVLAQSYLKLVNDNRGIGELESNPFAPLAIRSALRPPLELIYDKLHS
jgi:hypothetical protein